MQQPWLSALHSLSENTAPAPIHNNKNLSHSFIYIKKFFRGILWDPDSCSGDVGQFHKYPWGSMAYFGRRTVIKKVQTRWIVKYKPKSTVISLWLRQTATHVRSVTGLGGTILAVIHMHRLAAGWRPTLASKEICPIGTYSRLLSESGYTRVWTSFSHFSGPINTAFLGHHS